MPKLVNINGDELFKDVVLWNGTVFSDTGVLNVSHVLHEFKEIVLVFAGNAVSIVPVIDGVDSYTVPYAHKGTYIRTGVATITISGSTIRVTNAYIAHQFSASHPDESAINLLKIIGRY